MIHNKITRLLSLMAIVLFFNACDQDDPVKEVEYTYDGTNFEANAVTELALQEALSNLTTEMKKGRVAGTTVEQSTLSQLFQAGSPALAEITSNYYRDHIEGTNGWLAELAKASGGIYTPAPPQDEGGVYAGYLFDEHGLELEQIIEKGLFVAAMYQHAANLLDGALDETTADRVLAIFGSHPDFPNSDNSSLDHPDAFTAKYTARRDKNDGLGLYRQMEDALAKLQTAIAAGDDLQQEQEEAAETIRSTWEKAIFATVINYSYSTISKLSSTNATDEDKAGALHAYSEAAGFTYGWRGIPQSQKIITDAEVDELLALLNISQDGTATSYAFATDPVNELPKLTQVIEMIQTIYGFTDQELEDFKENWVSVQGR